MRIERGAVRDLLYLAIALPVLAVCIWLFRDVFGKYLVLLLFAVAGLLGWVGMKIMVRRLPDIDEETFERRYLSKYEDPLPAVHTSRETTARILGLKVSKLDPDADLRQVCRAVSLMQNESVVISELVDALGPHRTMPEGMSVADYIHQLVVAGQANQAGHR